MRSTILLAAHLSPQYRVPRARRHHPVHL